MVGVPSTASGRWALSRVVLQLPATPHAVADGIGDAARSYVDEQSKPPRAISRADPYSSAGRDDSPRVFTARRARCPVTPIVS